MMGFRIKHVYMMKIKNDALLPMIACMVKTLLIEHSENQPEGEEVQSLFQGIWLHVGWSQGYTGIEP